MTLLRAFVLLLFVAGAAFTVFAEDAKNPEGDPSPSASVSPVAAAAQAVAAPASTSACLTDPAVIEDLRRQRDALLSRERDIAAKEAELKAREEAILDELKKFDLLRKDLSKLEGKKKAENESRVNQLVETLDAMKPNAAAQLIGNLDETLAVTVMSRIAPQRLGKVMNLMEAAKASRLTELLAGVVRASKPAQKSGGNAASDGAAETTEQRKGGENI